MNKNEIMDVLSKHGLSLGILSSKVLGKGKSYLYNCIDKNKIPRRVYENLLCLDGFKEENFKNFSIIEDMSDEDYIDVDTLKVGDEVFLRGQTGTVIKEYDKFFLVQLKNYKTTIHKHKRKEFFL